VWKVQKTLAMLKVKGTSFLVWKGITIFYGAGRYGCTLCIGEGTTVSAFWPMHQGLSPRVQGRSHCAFPLVTTKNHRNEPLTLPYINLKATLANFTTAFVKFTTVQTCDVVGWHYYGVKPKQNEQIYHNNKHSCSTNI
jgi:hypothetical protein